MGAIFSSPGHKAFACFDAEFGFPLAGYENLKELLCAFLTFLAMSSASSRSNPTESRGSGAGEDPTALFLDVYMAKGCIIDDEKCSLFEKANRGAFFCPSTQLSSLDSTDTAAARSPPSSWTSLPPPPLTFAWWPSRAATWMWCGLSVHAELSVYAALAAAVLMLQFSWRRSRWHSLSIPYSSTLKSGVISWHHHKLTWPLSELAW